MLLDNLIKHSKEKYKKISVKGITCDSRQVKKDYIFFAIKGNKTSGLKFINEAILKGASAIISDKKIKYSNSSKPFILVKNVRESLAKASSNFYKKKPQNIIAVTGTNGKSSVADFFYQILKLNKVSAASIGTLGIISSIYKKKTNLTSMDPQLLHKNLEILAKKKINHVILEASSHGLQQRRLDNLNIKTGIFTNLSHDHLDYHSSMNSYLQSKMYLFKKLLNKRSTIITDETIKEFKIIKNIAQKRKIKMINIGNVLRSIKILSVKYRERKQIVKISSGSRIFLLEIPLIGNFQIKNLLMAVLAASTCGLNKNKIFKQISKIKSVPGRLECIKSLHNNSKIILDFAHTPEALKQSLVAIKKQFKSEILLVFGCGGERDKKKRSYMGKIAKTYCRKIFVTDDNPRNENPKKIRDKIIKFCGKKATDVGNRKKAIAMAIDNLRSREILLVAGKGHETTQDYGNKVINFSDRKIITGLVKKKKYSRKEVKNQNFLFKKFFNVSDIKIEHLKGVSINTKKIKKNNLFFAIKGKKNDGHNFVEEALKKGASKAIVSKNIQKVNKNKIIKVKNTLSSLNSLANRVRENTTAEIIGITGSAGKTTLKNLLSFALKNFGKTYSSPHSYNNKYGVPLSISNLEEDTKYGVFEIGMDKKGEISKLSKIVKPEIAVITNIAGAHFKNFKTLKDIANAKSEIIENIPEGGKIVLNKDGKFFKLLLHKSKKKKLKITSFSLSSKSDIFLKKIKKIKNYYRLEIIVRQKIIFFNVASITDNFISNVLACISVLSILDLDLYKLKNAFTKFSLPHGRGDIKIIRKFNKKIKFIDESYNANPLSMDSAIKNINSYKITRKSKKVVLLGDMLELGKKSKKFHKDLSNVINKTDIDKVFVYGKDIKITFDFLHKNKKGKIFNKLSEINDHFLKIINNNDLLMIKGSNATGLNQFSKNIKR